MINPTTGPVHPHAHAPAQPRGNEPARGDDFSTWLDLHPRPELPPKGAEEGRPVRDWLEQLSTHEGPNPMPVPQPPNTMPVMEPLAAPVEAVSAAVTSGEVATPEAAMTDAFEAMTNATQRGLGADGERIDFVSVLWHLQANAGLSYRSMEGTGQPAAMQQAGAASLLSVQSSGRGAPQLVGAPPMFGENAAQSVALQRLTLMAELRGARQADAGAGASGVLPNRAGWAPLLMWPQRVLRWLGDGEGTTAWVRDYQIDLSKVQSLLDSLRCLAEQQGLPLRRVMLNGHELWRSPSTP